MKGRLSLKTQSSLKSKIDFWDCSVLGWEKSRYESWVPISGWTLRRRMKKAASFVHSLARGTSLVDLGCGTGRFFRLLDPNHFSSLTGIDFSATAIGEAQSLCCSERIRFQCRSITKEVLPEADCYVGLGVLDWLSDDEIRELFRQVSSRKFIFSFSEKRHSPLRKVHGWFRARTIKNKVSDYQPRYFGLDEILRFFPSDLDLNEIYIYREVQMTFGALLTNFKSDPSSVPIISGVS